MNPRIKELWVIPIAVALATGIPLGVVFMFLSLWLAGTPIHVPFSPEWIKAALSTSLPLWVTLTLLAVVAIIVGMFFRQRARTAEERVQKVSIANSLRLAENQIAKLNEEHAAEVAKLKANEPRLHGVWNNAQTFWHLGKKGEAPMMQIGGWIDLTSSNTQETIYLLAAYINGQRSDIFIDVEVKPNTVNREMVMLLMVPPLETNVTKPFTATVVVEDQYNRKFELPTQTFRATPGQAQIPVQMKPVPQLHIAWRFSGWCWVMHNGEKVLRVSGDGTFVLDNVREPVIFTNVRIKDGEYVGVFDTFELKPSEPDFRGLNVDFKGKTPNGRESITAELTFVDLRGNEYSTPEVIFKPLTEPERFGGLRWPEE